MEIQLQELIEKIKKDGVGEAEAKAQATVDAANEQAAQIIAEAKAEASRIISQAEDETARLTKASEDAIRQASRNQLISFRDSVSRELSAITSKAVKECYTKDTLTQLIAKTVELWSKNTAAEDITVILSDGDLKELEDAVISELNARLCSGVTLKADSRMDGGFRIAKNDSGAYYDYSAEAVADLLSAYLSPKVAQLMKEASK